MRTDLLLKCKPYKPSIIRGNASEIIALAGLWGLEGGSHTSDVRGVDSTDAVYAAKSAAIALANWTGGAVAVSGEADLITDGRQVVISKGGSAMMPLLRGRDAPLAASWLSMRQGRAPLLQPLPGQLSTIWLANELLLT